MFGAIYLVRTYLRTDFLPSPPPPRPPIPCKNMYAFRVTVSAVGLLQKILTNTPLLNEGKVKFLQIKQDTVQQNMKRDVSVSAYEYMKHDILLPLCASVNILDDPLHSPSCVHN